MDKWAIGDVASALVGGAIGWWRGDQSHHAETDSGDKSKGVSNWKGFISKVDEGMWASLITRLDDKQKWAITCLLKHLNRFHEKESFRYTIINMPVATMVVEEEVKDPSDPTGRKKKTLKKVVKVGEYSADDTRVVFLKKIADLVDDSEWGLTNVRDMLRTHQLATENKVARDALKFWNEAVCQVFGVDNPKDVTMAHVEVQLHTLALKIPNRPKTGSAFRHQGVLNFTIILFGFIIMVICFWKVT